MQIDRKQMDGYVYVQHKITGKKMWKKNKQERGIKGSLSRLSTICTMHSERDMCTHSVSCTKLENFIGIISEHSVN